MKHYIYDGPVTSFGNVVQGHWEAETYAHTKKKACGNLTYRFKTEHGLLPQSKITLQKGHIKEL